VHSYGRCEQNHNTPQTAAGREEKEVCWVPEHTVTISHMAPGLLLNFFPDQEIFKAYKFAFTPENSNDEGYVTEKVYSSLKAGK
jgi:hypothetical protein